MAGIDYSNTITALVTSAIELSDTQRAILTSRLSDKLLRPVMLNLTVDPAVLGGLRIYVDGLHIDNTIKKQIDNMKAGIKERLVNGFTSH
jgi:F-type H+-transporting ATPase subunit delta